MGGCELARDRRRNIFRGLARQQGRRGIDRATGDYMGMLATVINSLAMQDALEARRSPRAVRDRAPPGGRALHPPPRGAAPREGPRRISRPAPGTSSRRHRCEPSRHGDRRRVIFKATRVDGVYDADPEKHPEARRFDELTYIDVLNRQLQVMDATAISLCMDNSMPILVFNLMQRGNILRAVQGERIGTLVYGGRA
jgi:uridylate kinase